MLASCLCGAVEIQIGAFAGPFDLCHCNRCKKHTGSAFNAVVDTEVAGFKVLKGADNMQSYSVPVVESPPAYQVWFCKGCGSPLPNPKPSGDIVEVPVGLIDGEINITPDKSVFSEYQYPWLVSISKLRSFTKAEFIAFRKKHGSKRCDD